MLLDEDFKFRDDLAKKYETVPVELLVGPWKGTTLRYTKVNIREQKNGTARLGFDYDLITIPDGLTEATLRKDAFFNEHAGLILNALILEYVDIHESGKSNSEEPAKK